MGKKKAINKDYKKAVDLAYESLLDHMADQTSSAVLVAILRDAWITMKAQLDKNSFYPTELEAKKKGTAAIAWGKYWYEYFDKKYQPYYYDTDAYSKKHEDYLDFILKQMDRLKNYKRYLIDRTNNVFYVQKFNDLAQEVGNLVLQELMPWSTAHRADPGYLKMSPEDGLTEMLIERQDLVVALREAQNLGMDTTKYNIPVYKKDRPWYVDVVEIGVSFIPIVGSVVAAYEASTGRDLFGYSLDPLERGIIGATVLLPFAGRFAKQGKALYTASRMEKMYGRDAKVWSKMLASGESLNKNSQALRTLREAKQMIASQTEWSSQLVKDVNKVVGAEVKGMGQASLTVTVRKEVTEAMTKLSTKYKVLDDLDELALERIVAKGPNTDHLKGQLLEEMLEAKVVRWLQDPFAAKALGLPGTIRSHQELQFIPGHLVRDSLGRQISDGMIVRKTSNNAYEILAIFEAKAGKSASRELSLASSTLSAADKKELRAYAKDVYRELEEQARLEGKQVTQTIEEIEEDIILSEKGGQVRRDIERLTANEDGALTKIHIGASEVEVIVSPKGTKVFGVLPKDIKPSTMEKELKDLGYDFEIMWIDIDSKELKDIAKILTPLI